MMSQASTRWAIGVLIILVLGIGIVLWRTVPWNAGEPGQRGQKPVSADFSDEQQHREQRFHQQLRPLTLGALGLSLLVAVVLGFLPWGARLIDVVARPLGGSWPVTALVGGLTMVLIGYIVTVPLRIKAEMVLREYGLSTQNWSNWFLDTAKSALISAVLASLACVLFYALVRAAPRWWWAPMSLLAAGLVFALSFLYPVLFEPIFNKFTPMEHNELRHELVEMARADGVPVDDVLVADASRRTTALNAYVSGFGASRRIVVYDTLLTQAPASEVKLVVAHELGHAKRNDVLFGTAIGALGAAIAVIVGYLMMSSTALLARAGVSELRDPRSLALIFALLAIAGLVTSPIQGLISRRIEARADQHSLDLTQDPSTFIQMHRRLASKNLSDLQPNPVLYVMFGSHPSATLRLGHAREFARMEHIGLSPDLNGETKVGT